MPEHDNHAILVLECGVIPTTVASTRQVIVFLNERGKQNATRNAISKRIEQGAETGEIRT